MDGWMDGWIDRCMETCFFGDSDERHDRPQAVQGVLAVTWPPGVRASRGDSS